ncbi:DUF2064 domain-containing protein [Aeromicrobium sp. CTD01-1L150]|uniref:TIGR04282 family arsenosugar biosynthesis glycosyltransferase n=1 Tax=Aeromicrobium sp. CTD01-1L150 TaxID=3341830 RepID=UPI0035C12B30
MSAPTVLIVAKAPVPGLAKTRLAGHVGEAVAADFAAAALLDTLDAARATGWPVVVSMTGDLDRAARAEDLRTALADVEVVPQRGTTFAERLVNAHADAARGHGVVQVGMDTPQVSAEQLREAGDLLADHRAVLGHAEDGGWWLLALRDPADAAALVDVEMSTTHTGADTAAVLPAPLAQVDPARDVDEWQDAFMVASSYVQLRAAAVVREAGGQQ